MLQMACCSTITYYRGFIHVPVGSYMLQWANACSKELVHAPVGSYMLQWANTCSSRLIMFHRAHTCFKGLIHAYCDIVYCTCRHGETVELLLRYSADIDVQDGHWRTPLMLACSHAHPAEAVTKALINAGCDVNIIGESFEMMILPRDFSQSDFLHRDYHKKGTMLIFR